MSDYIAIPIESKSLLNLCYEPSVRLASEGEYASSSISVRTIHPSPTPIVTAPSVNSFKRKLDSAWEEMFAEIP